MNYNIETLSKINNRFIGTHYKLYQSDVEIANELITMIENTRSVQTPKPGDIVRYTDEQGSYYQYAHIEDIKENTANICENGNTYIGKSNNNLGFYLSTSGGAWHDIDINKMVYLGTENKPFWTFGHCGACADGGISFYANVNVWEYNINKMNFSTKTHNKYYISYSDKEIGIGYHFTTDGKAWRTEKELQAWIRTFRGVIYKNWHNQIIVFTYKEAQKHVSPEEYNNINGIEDVMTYNGKRRCKRVYDDENYIVYTFFVWYWDDPTMGDWRQQAEKQNELRKQWEVDWSVPENIFAIEELRTGKIKAIDIMTLFKAGGQNK